MASLVRESHMLSHCPTSSKKKHTYTCTLAIACVGDGNTCDLLLPCVVPAYTGARVSPRMRCCSMCCRQPRYSLCSSMCSASHRARLSSSLCFRQWAPVNTQLSRAPTHVCPRVCGSASRSPLCMSPQVCNPLGLMWEQERRNDVSWPVCRTDVLLLARNRWVRCVVIHLMLARNNLVY
jgi:hypothetical protein